MNLNIPRGTADPRRLAFAFGAVRPPEPQPNPPQPKPKPKKAKPALCVNIGWQANKAVSGCLWLLAGLFLPNIYEDFFHTYKERLC